MKRVIVACLVLGTAGDAQALSPGGPGQDFGIYNVSASLPTVVGTTLSGNDLVALTLTVANISGDSARDLNGIANVTIGSNGALHHEQSPSAIPVFAYPTPLASSFTNAGVAASSVDSHFLVSPGGDIPGGDPGETFSTVPSGVAPERLDGVFPTVTTGFGGVLTASYAFPTTVNSVDIAYLVFENRGILTGVDFTLRPTNAAGVSEDLNGCIGFPEGCIHDIPEASAASLLGVAAPFAARRGRSSALPDSAYRGFAL